MKIKWVTVEQRTIYHENGMAEVADLRMAVLEREDCDNVPISKPLIRPDFELAPELPVINLDKHSSGVWWPEKGKRK